METYDKQKVMSLSNSQLVEYINYMLSQGWSMERLNKEKGIRRQTIRDRLKKYDYVYNAELHQYVPIEGDIIPVKTNRKPQENPKKAKPGILLDDVLKRVEALEKAVKLNGTNPNEFKLIKFESEKQQNRNYPLYQEVIDLIDEVVKEHPQYKVKDIVNSAIYIALSNWKDSNNIG